jgi:hypothetical protein
LSISSLNQIEINKEEITLREREEKTIKISPNKNKKKDTNKPNTFKEKNNIENNEYERKENEYYFTYSKNKKIKFNFSTIQQEILKIKIKKNPNKNESFLFSFREEEEKHEKKNLLNFLNYENFLLSLKNKIKIIIEDFNERREDEEKIIEKIYEIYLLNFYNYVKSTQIFIYKNSQKEFFVKILNLNFEDKYIIENFLKKADKNLFDIFEKIPIKSKKIKFIMQSNQKKLDSNNNNNENYNNINEPKILNFFKNSEKFGKKFFFEIKEIFINIQKDFFKDLIFKVNIESNSICKFKGFYFSNNNNNDNLKIYLFFNYYKTSLREIISKNLYNKKDKINLLKNLLDIIKNIKKENFTLLNLTFDNIRFTKNDKIKIVSLKYAIKKYNDSEKDYDNNYNFSCYHFGYLNNFKINFPPEFYDCKKEIINYSNLDFIDIEKIDIWSLGILIVYIFGKSIKKRYDFYEDDNYNNYDNDYNNDNGTIREKNEFNCVENLFEVFYLNKKIFPERIFNGFDHMDVYIKAISVGILRYFSYERPDFEDIIKNMDNFFLSID